MDVLEEAARLISGDRNLSYGTPVQNFTNIADMWTVRFGHKLKDGEKFTATDVADAMILLKVARNIAQRKRDNYADLAGYAGCGYEAMLDEERSASTDSDSAAGGLVPSVRDSTSTDAQITIEVSSPGDVESAAEAIRAELHRINRGRQDRA